MILSAATSCVEKLGFEKTTLNDIAIEAGVARSTIYSYYLNRDDVIRFALLHSAYGFVEKVAAHLVTVPEGAHRIIESIIYCLNNLPHEPCLALITNTKLNKMVNEHTLTTEAGFTINTEIFKFLIGDTHLSNCKTSNSIENQAEITLRTLFSLLNLQSPKPRNNQELRQFIAHWLLPALQLEIPDQYQ